ncbi:MAG: transferase hexapeptide repeat family protein [Chitinophagaceae bacterium]
MFYTFNGHTPVCHPSSYVHPQAAVTGNVVIGKHCYIGPGAALRGDWGQIILEDGCNVQENCTVHMFPGLTVTLQKGAHIGHGAVIHGATIGRHCLIGINAVIMDHVVLGDECIVGALAFIKEGEQFERRSLIAGLPAKFIRKVSNEMMAWKKDGTALYQALPAQLHSSSQPCEPLRKKPSTTKMPEASYETWQNRQKKKKAKPDLFR